jgi:hypothetical protein
MSERNPPSRTAILKAAAFLAGLAVAGAFAAWLLELRWFAVRVLLAGPLILAAGKVIRPTR